jgi:integrase
MLLQAENVDIYTIALWLGHATVTSTERYLNADNKLKQAAIDKAAPLGTRPGRYRPTDTLLAFLEQL